MRATQRQHASGGTGVGFDFSGIPAHAPLNAAHEVVRGQGSALPFRDAIQKSFGRHDVSSVAAHTGAKSATAARALGAEAFTIGEDVTFSATPSLHTAAHEAAHAVQQRSGLALQDRVGSEGDAHERHADAVADRVVRGQSSEMLLDTYAPATRTDSGASLQMKKLPTHYGEFEDVRYAAITNKADKEIGCEMFLRFTPNDKVDADLIGMTQSIKPTKEGNLDAVDDTKKSQAVTSGVGKDSYIDQYSGTRNPLYATTKAPASGADKMEKWDTGPKVKEASAKEQQANADAGQKGIKYERNFGQHGYRKKAGAGWASQPAELHDWPTRPGSVGKKNSGQVFETTALAITGSQKDLYYGSVQWGWQRDGSAAFSLVDLKAISQGTPSAGFLAAAQKWNTSKTSGNEANLTLPVADVYVTNKATEVLVGTTKVNLPVGTRVQIVSKGADATKPWQVTIVDGPDTGAKVSLDGATLTKE
jgi:hypothetical protein